jgi:hypothetical protein
MANTSWAISTRIGYLGALTFHKSKMSKSLVVPLHPSSQKKKG